MTDKRSDRGSSGAAVPAGSGDLGSGQAEGSGAAAADMQMLIGRQLRAVYDDIAKQPVPDRFIELMKQLDKQPASS